ncbi:MAG TPA: tetratricopeptide repeat protein [Steroidobacteraceae bacterium]|nr:tetratricopeptide repeat protein [Steroidobacteraceae bacterium]
MSSPRTLAPTLALLLAGWVTAPWAGAVPAAAPTPGTAAGSAGGETAPAACAASRPGVAEMEFQGTLNKDPDAVDTRIRLANALSDRGCYADAVRLLEAGLERDPDSRLLKERLRSARSTQSEQGYFEGLGHAEEAAKAQRNLLRCRDLADLASCDQALAATPNDRDLLVAKGDALVRAGRPAEALTDYDKAAGILPADETLKGKTAAAESARQTFVNRCLGEKGDAALAACDQGLRHGARDEFAIYQRKGVLLQAVDQSARALDAYIAAAMLEPGDRAVAQAIVALTDSSARQDPVALTARNTALQTLGRGQQSIATPTVAARAIETPKATALKAGGPKAAAAKVAVAAAATLVSYSNREPAGESH